MGAGLSAQAVNCQTVNYRQYSKSSLVARSGKERLDYCSTGNYRLAGDSGIIREQLLQITHNQALRGRS
jgi:hypothetical protein